MSLCVRACAATMWLLAATGPQALDAPSRHPSAPVTRRVALMGTWAALTTYAGSRTEAVSALDAKVRILEQTESELSTWRPTSALSQINRLPIGAAGALDPPLCRLLERVQHWQRRTAGAFDPAIGALIAAWDLRGAGRIPTEAELALARARAGWTYVALDGQACLLRRRRDVTLDAGAFGKGEALDRILATGEDVGPWLVDLGGQVAVSGPRPDGSGWPVALAHAGRRHLGLIDLELRGGSLATSAGSERDRVVAARRVGHVIDPRSGHPAPFNGSVTVWHERALAADILSTALFVMGPPAGLRWAERHDVAALFQVPDGASATGPLALRPSRAFVRQFPGWAPVVNVPRRTETPLSRSRGRPGQGTRRKNTNAQPRVR